MGEALMAGPLTNCFFAAYLTHYQNIYYNNIFGEKKVKGDLFLVKLGRIRIQLFSPESDPDLIFRSDPDPQL